MKTVVHWFRRDLRVGDNTALSEAVQRAETVVPVFILEDSFRTGPDVGGARLQFLLSSLEELRRTLEAIGYTLIIRAGRSEVELPKLCQKIGAQAVFCNKRYEPYAQARDERVIGALNGIGVGFETFKDAVAWEEREILTKAGNPFTVFTPYSKSWRAQRIPAPRNHLPKTKRKIAAIRSDRLPATAAELCHPSTQQSFDPGEAAAQAALERFLSGAVFEYGGARDFPALNQTSGLSAHLRCGTIGIRNVLARLKAVRAAANPKGQGSCDVFLTELIWREFYLQVLANFPQVMRGSFRPEYDALQWSDNDGHFRAWCQGLTGYPLVDAAMRCLNATGWMHNRLRMVVAMFLTKDLLINWQRGERYFMQQLVDGDLAANNGGWQWSAGTGTDAAPYFRIFNPVSQALRFDPDGEFTRHWLPELAAFKGAVIHEPWRDPDLLAKSRYPRRVVRHEEQRLKCLEMFRRVKRNRPGLTKSSRALPADATSENPA